MQYRSIPSSPDGRTEPTISNQPVSEYERALVPPTEPEATLTTTLDRVPDHVPSWRIPAIDGFRALAALMVFSTHASMFAHNPQRVITLFGYPMELFGIFRRAAYGVDLFMVLSGFCLFWPLCKSASALTDWGWKDFYRRRIRRIAPPYYAAIAFASLLPNAFVVLMRMLHTPAHWQRLPGTPFAYVAHLLFVQTLFPQSLGQINASLWSMALEAQFYLVFPLVILGYRKFGFRAIGAIAIVSLLYNLIGFSMTYGHALVETQIVRGLFPARWIEFVAGMGAAYIVAHHRRAARSLSGWIGSALFLASLGGYAAAASWSDSPWAFDSLAMALVFATAIIAVCATRTPFRRLFENRAMDRLGFISYSFFLIHWPVTYYVAKLLMRTRLHGPALFAAIVCVALPIVTAMAYGFFQLFERPFLSAGRVARVGIGKDIHHVNEAVRAAVA